MPAPATTPLCNFVVNMTVVRRWYMPNFQCMLVIPARDPSQALHHAREHAVSRGGVARILDIEVVQPGTMYFVERF